MPDHIKGHQKESSHTSKGLLRGILGIFFLPVLFHWTVAEIQAGGENGPMSQAPLFWAGQGGYDTYRIPALAVTPKGTLLAFCEARRDSQRDWGNIDLVLRRSLDHGKTWEPVQVIVDDDGNTCGNPCPIVDRKDGTVILLLTKNNGMENEGQILQGSAAPRTVWSTLSRDEGLTWSAPIDISDQASRPDWRWYATGPCHGIQLSDGRLIAPCDHATGPNHEDMHSHIIFSDDGGANWKIGGILEKLTNECAVVELTDGSLYLNARSPWHSPPVLVHESRQGDDLVACYRGSNTG